MAASISDPLLALRQAIQTKADIELLGADGSPVPSLGPATELVLGPDVTFPKGTPTRLRRPTPGEMYALEAVYLAWFLRDAPGAEYIKQAREAGLAAGFVSVTERKRLVDWLEGTVEEHDGLVPTAGACYDIWLQNGAELA
jgi:parafibromin